MIMPRFRNLCTCNFNCRATIAMFALCIVSALSWRAISPSTSRLLDKALDDEVGSRLKEEYRQQQREILQSPTSQRVEHSAPQPATTRSATSAVRSMPQRARSVAKTTMQGSTSLRSTPVVTSKPAHAVTQRYNQTLSITSASASSSAAPKKKIITAPTVLVDEKTGIRLGTFLYMVLGEGEPQKRWLDRASWTDVYLLYVSWKSDVTVQLQGHVSETFRYVFYAKSTWTSSRNHMAKLGHQWELEQKWRFEYFVFFDEDVLLGYRTPENPTKVVLDFPNDDTALHKFNEVLLRDRPMKAGVSFNEFDWNKKNLRCQSRCQADNLVMAYHRSANRFLEPYTTHFDKTNWWLSAYILNMYISVIGPEYCASYNEIVVDRKTQVHNYKYPRNELMWDDAIMFVNQCLSEGNFSDFSIDSKITAVRKQIQTSLSREPYGWPDCKRNAQGVNFGELLKSKTSFPQTCR